MKYFEKVAKEYEELTSKELKENLEKFPARAMLPGVAAGGLYGMAAKKPRLSYSMMGGAAAFGTLDALRKYFSYQELEKRKKE